MKCLALSDRIHVQAALCLYKLGRSVEALRLAESALTTCCSLDAQRFQLRGLILHDLRRYTEAAKVNRYLMRNVPHPQSRSVLVGESRALWKIIVSFKLDEKAQNRSWAFSF